MRQRRGDLAADVGAADQHDLLGVRDALADRVGVAERAQVVDLLELAAARRSAAARSRRSRSAPCRTRPPACSRASPCARCRSRPVTLVRVSSSMSCSPHHSSGRKNVLLARLLAAQVALRALRAVVRRVGLAADEQHLARRRLPRAASARSSPTRGLRRSAGSRPCGPPWSRTLQPRRVTNRPVRPGRDVVEDPPARAVFVAVGADVGAVVAGVQAQARDDDEHVRRRGRRWRRSSPSGPAPAPPSARSPGRAGSR